MTVSFKSHQNVGQDSCLQTWTKWTHTHTHKASVFDNPGINLTVLQTAPFRHRTQPFCRRCSNICICASTKDCLGKTEAAKKHSCDSERLILKDQCNQNRHRNQPGGAGSGPAEGKVAKQGGAVSITPAALETLLELLSWWTAAWQVCGHSGVDWFGFGRLCNSRSEPQLGF